MEIMDIATKLNRLKVHIDPTYLVHSALDSLAYGQMKSIYNTLKEDWTMDYLITIVILENRTQACGDVVNLVTTKKYENKGVAKWEVKKLLDQLHLVTSLQDMLTRTEQIFLHD
ncbi:unnamed protein product [Prunus armeniaca]